MSAIFPPVNIDKNSLLSEIFLPYQISWIRAEDHFHERKQQVFALAEKSVRIGWTYADAFKNVRKRLRFARRDYLFATKDYPSALEYMRVAHQFTGMYNFTRAIVSHGEDYLKVPREGSTLTEEIKIGYIKFDNGSRIIAFSANPQAMAVYGGDVGLDEFAKHPNAELLWETAQGRVTWGYDLAVWSAHDGEDTLFNQLAQEARAQCGAGESGAGVAAGDPFPSLAPLRGEGRGEGLPSSDADTNLTKSTPHPSPLLGRGGEGVETEAAEEQIANQKSQIANRKSLWNLYYRVTVVDAIELGLLDVIN